MTDTSLTVLDAPFDSAVGLVSINTYRGRISKTIVAWRNVDSLKAAMVGLESRIIQSLWKNRWMNPWR